MVFAEKFPCHVIIIWFADPTISVRYIIVLSSLPEASKESLLDIFVDLSYGTIVAKILNTHIGPC